MAIIDFILARIREEEDLAHRALDEPSSCDPSDTLANGAHASYWNAWRVQSACITRRLIVSAHRNTGPIMVSLVGAEPDLVAATCQTCRDRQGQPAAWPCYTLRVLATEWANHPDFHREWSPSGRIALR